MKLPHRDIVNELKAGKCNSVDTWTWKNGNEQAMVNVSGC
jgi:hypothetical protein